MKQPELHDYFFVVESGPGLADTAVYARGEGLQVMSALARVSLLKGAGVAAPFDFSQVLGGNSLYGLAQEQLAGRAYFPPPATAMFRTGASGLSEVMYAHYALNGLIDEHQRRVLNQVQQGARSPASADREFTTLTRDLRCLDAASRFWLDEQGLRCRLPAEDPQRPRPAPDLRRVTQSIRRYDPDLHQEIFGQVPKGGKAYQVETLPLQKYRNEINQSRPFVHGAEVQTTYGYVAVGSTDFVALFSRPANWHFEFEEGVPRPKNDRL